MGDVAAAGGEAPLALQFLNYGGLGLLALICLIVLGQNAWNLNALVKAADPQRIVAAKPLLLMQMGISVVGLVFVGAGAIYLAKLDIDDKKDRRAVVLVDPWADDPGASYNPQVRIGEGPYKQRPIRLTCTPGEPTYVSINFKPYIDHLVQNSIRNREALLQPTASPLAER